MANRFMTRIFSAQDKQEDEILDQIQNDVEIAMEDGELDTEEYSISKFSDDSVVITDKGNGEQTKATVSEGEINLEEMPKEGPEEHPEEHPESEEVKTECDRKFSDKTQKYIDKLKKFSEAAQKSFAKMKDTGSISIRFGNLDNRDHSREAEGIRDKLVSDCKKLGLSVRKNTSDYGDLGGIAVSIKYTKDQLDDLLKLVNRYKILSYGYERSNNSLLVSKVDKKYLENGFESGHRLSAKIYFGLSNYNVIFK